MCIWIQRSTWKTTFEKLAYHDNIMEIGERLWAPQMLPPKTVLKFKHSELEASKTGRSAFYTDKMADCISSSLNPSKDVPVMPTVPFLQRYHVPHEPLDLGDHQLIDRRDWHGYPGFQEAINNQRDGLLENETWSYDRNC